MDGITTTTTTDVMLPQVFTDAFDKLVEDVAALELHPVCCETSSEFMSARREKLSKTDNSVGVFFIYFI